MLLRCCPRVAEILSAALIRSKLRSPASALQIARRKASRLSYYHAPSDVPLLPLTVGQVIDRAADTMGDNVAIISCHQNITKTYVQYKLDVDHLAAALASLRLPVGSMIGLMAANIYEWTVVQFASAKAGLILVNINTAYQVPELEYCLETVDCAAVILSEIFTRQDNYAMMLQIAPELEHSSPGELKCKKLPSLKYVIMLGDEVKPGTIRYDDLLAQATSKDYATVSMIEKQIRFDSPVNVQFTSGTTGKPKGALLSHFNIVNNANSLGPTLGLDKNDVICLNVPLIHCFGCVMGSLAASLFGSTIVMPASAFNAVASLGAITKHKCSVIYGTPTMYIDLLRHLNDAAYDVSSVRKGIMAGAPCPPEVIKNSMEQLNVKRLCICYGSTECSPVITATNPDEPVEKWIHTVGKPLGHVEVKVVDSSNNIVPLGTRGELCARGYLVFKRYHNQPDMTKDAVRDRWYHTGDEAIMTEDGHVIISGRIKDMICRGGENVYPLEVEEFLYTHPDIEEVQVVGVPDKRLGEEVCAWIKLKEGKSLTGEDVKKFCEGKISHFKTPKYILFVDTFPKTISGKIQKFKIREESRKKFKL
ncbi:medium-chain acyl-CoA ligase ACSF2, mitochondrial isoform X1 [Rhipicephalus microplus]|uniref:medium-chain acyl-CoA ligase ACSF2, mitochondrial isoform X1 n=1 Tax=Rhipicephalus microplus TaxID=6941 RepID=UPI003F6CF5B9